MKRYIPAIAILTVLLIGAAALAASTVKPNWWPGEGPGRPGPAPKDGIVGKVTAVSSAVPGSITLDTRFGPLDFAVTSETRIMVRGVKATIADIKVDDPARVAFVVQADGTRVARGIAIPKPAVFGRITAVANGVVTLRNPQRTWQVTIGPNTKIRSEGYEGTVADLHVGYEAEAEGPISGDTVQAEIIRFHPTVIKGVVRGVSGNVVTVQTLRQRIATVTITDATVIHVMPRTAPNYKGTPADIVPGTAINVGGHITGEGAMTAVWVKLLTTGPGKPGRPASRPAANQRPLRR